MVSPGPIRPAALTAVEPFSDRRAPTRVRARRGDQLSAAVDGGRGPSRLSGARQPAGS